jgi:hypothetical protein
MDRDCYNWSGPSVYWTAGRERGWPGVRTESYVPIDDVQLDIPFIPGQLSP